MHPTAFRLSTLISSSAERGQALPSSRSARRFHLCVGRVAGLSGGNRGRWPDGVGEQVESVVGPGPVRGPAEMDSLRGAEPPGRDVDLLSADRRVAALAWRRHHSVDAAREPPAARGDSGT